MDEDVMIYPKIAVRKSRWEAQKALSKAEGIFHSDWIRRALDAWEALAEKAKAK